MEFQKLKRVRTLCSQFKFFRGSDTSPKNKNFDSKNLFLGKIIVTKIFFQAVINSLWSSAVMLQDTFTCSVHVQIQDVASQVLLPTSFHSWVIDLFFFPFAIVIPLKLFEANVKK